MNLFLNLQNKLKLILFFIFQNTLFETFFTPSNKQYYIYLFIYLFIGIRFYSFIYIPLASATLSSLSGFR